MSPLRILAVLIIAAGVAGLIYPSFSYTKDQSQVKLGPLEFTVKDKETVNVPVWISAGAIAIGVVLLLVGGRKR